MTNSIMEDREVAPFVEGQRVDYQGQTVEIFDRGGAGLPMFLLHSNSSSARAFTALYQSKLSEQFRLIAINLPGHGRSSMLNPESSFTIESLGDLLADVVNSFKFEEYYILGQSIGGHIVLESIERFENMQHLILVSAPPVNLHILPTAFAPDPSGGLLFAKQVTEADATKLAECFSTRFSKTDKEQLIADICNTHGDFRSRLGQSLAEGKMLDECMKLKQSTIPCTLFYGTDDRFLNVEYMDNLDIDGLTLKRYQDCGHCLIQENTSQFVEDILALK